MGRKIPARKHHGARDPIKQAEIRHMRIKDKINNPPSTQNNQKLSYKLNQFAKLKQDTKVGKVKRHLYVQHREDKPQNSKQKKFAPVVPRENETVSQYMRRVNQITTQGIKEAQYEAKYGVEVTRDDKTGHITVKKRPKDEITELMNEKMKRKKKQTTKSAIDPKLAKSLVKQAIKESNEEEETEKTKLQEYKYDSFKFGEVVQAPPTLVAPRRAQKADTVPRPAMKGNLLLQKLFNPNSEETTDKEDASTSERKVKAKKSSVDLKGKRKDLPEGARLMLEHQQMKAVELYRQMKKSKMKDFASYGQD